jgi:hypothetical protein
MQIIAKYARATLSSNLRDDAHHHDTAALAAAALCEGEGSAGIGSILWRVKYANDAARYAELLEKWGAIVKTKAAVRKWPSHISPPVVARIALDYFLADICPACGGRGYQLLPDVARPVLSDVPCGDCDGRGARPLACERRLMDYCRDMVESLADIERATAGRVMRKLAGEMGE